jgi:hypothetical protein
VTAGPGILDAIRADLLPHGIFVRGIARFEDGECAQLADGREARSVVLLGNIGGSLWRPFLQWWSARDNIGRSDPLDAWSKEVIGPVAARAGATAYFPSDPPWQPFQQWAIRAEGLQASPLGILIHPVYGLWHGYRGALAFAIALEERSPPRMPEHPCQHCLDKPCLTTCPAGAVTTQIFDVPACRSHLATNAGQSGCMTAGCLARTACPVGPEYRYSAEQLAFHMAALHF